MWIIWTSPPTSPSRSSARAIPGPRWTASSREYFDAGARLVWYVYPRTKTVKVFTSPRKPTTFREHETLDGGDVLPGFALPLKDLFARA